MELWLRDMPFPCYIFARHMGFFSQIYVKGFVSVEGKSSHFQKYYNIRRDIFIWDSIIFLIHTLSSGFLSNLDGINCVILIDWYLNIWSFCCVINERSLQIGEGVKRILMDTAMPGTEKIPWTSRCTGSSGIVIR